MIFKSTTSTLSVCGGRLCSQSQESSLKKENKKGLKGGKDTEEEGGSFVIVC